MSNEREKLKKRWLEILTPSQRGAWSIYVSKCPDSCDPGIRSDRTGQEMFIACNLLIKE